MTPTDKLVATLKDIASFKIEDALDARREMDGDRYADFDPVLEDKYLGLDEERRLCHRQSEQDEWRQDDDRQRAQDINAERKLLGF